MYFFFVGPPNLFSQYIHWHSFWGWLKRAPPLSDGFQNQRVERHSSHRRDPFSRLPFRVLRPCANPPPQGPMVLPNCCQGPWSKLSFKLILLRLGCRFGLYHIRLFVIRHGKLVGQSGLMTGSKSKKALSEPKKTFTNQAPKLLDSFWLKHRFFHIWHSWLDLDLNVLRVLETSTLNGARCQVEGQHR